MPIANVVAVYATRAAAEKARNRLLEEGLEEGKIHLSPDCAEVEKGKNSCSGFWQRLVGSLKAEGDRDRFQAQVRMDRTSLAVCTEERHLESVENTLGQFEPIDINETIGGDDASEDDPLGSNAPRVLPGKV